MNTLASLLCRVFDAAQQLLLALISNAHSLLAPPSASPNAAPSTPANPALSLFARVTGQGGNAARNSQGHSFAGLGSIPDLAAGVAGVHAGSARSLRSMPATASALVSELLKLAWLPSELGIPGSSNAKRVLARMGDVCAAKDWPLAWSIMPRLVLASDKSLPAAGVAMGLRVKSPPPFASVLQHLKRVSVCAL